MSRVLLSTCLLGLTAAALATPLHADVATWTGTLSSLWNVAGNWSTPSFPNNGGTTFDVVIDGEGGGNAVVDLNQSVDVDSLFLGAGDLLTFENGDDLGIEVGPLTNDGTIVMAGTGSSTFLTFLASTSLDGTGALELSNSFNTQLRGDDTRIAHGADHTIRGGGQVRLVLLDNAGTIEATDGELRVNLDAPPPGDPNTNTGLMRADGATLHITGTELDNNGGMIRADANGIVEIVASVIEGGVLATTGNGEIHFPSSPPTLHAVRNTGLIRVENSVDPFLIDSFENDGTFRLESSNASTQLTLLTPVVTIDGDGVIETSENSGNAIVADTLTEQLIHGAEHTIQGTLTIRCNLVNHGALLANSPLGMQIDASPVAVNHGFIHVTNDGWMQIDGDAFTTTGQLTIDSGHTLTRNGDFMQTGGTTSVNGLMLVDNNDVFLTGGRLGGAGVIECRMVHNDGGIVAPGPPMTTFEIDGDYVQTTNGVTEISANGTTNDVLAITGNAMLQGELRLVYPAGAYDVDDEIVVLTADTIEAGYDCITGPDAPYEVAYIDGQAVVTIGENPCDGDVLGVSDGQVDVGDLLAVLSAWGQAGGCIAADLDGNGAVDVGDLLIVLANFGPCP